MSQALTDARACLMFLDVTLDEQISSLLAVPPSSEALRGNMQVHHSRRGRKSKRRTKTFNLLIFVFVIVFYFYM